MPNKVENFRAMAASVREVVIVLVLVFFLLFPGLMKDVFTRAGFTSVSFGGMEVELQASVQKTQEAGDNVARLEAQLQAANDRLQQIGQQPATPPEVRQQIEAVSTDVQRTSDNTRAVRDTLRSNLAEQQNMLRRVAPQLLQRPLAAPR